MRKHKTFMQMLPFFLVLNDAMLHSSAQRTGGVHLQLVHGCKYREGSHCRAPSLQAAASGNSFVPQTPFLPGMCSHLWTVAPNTSVGQRDCNPTSCFFGFRSAFIRKWTPAEATARKIGSCSPLDSFPSTLPAGRCSPSRKQ